MKKNITILTVIIVTLALALSGCTSKEEKAAIQAFKEASAKVETMNNDLDKTISEAETMISTNEKAFDDNAIKTLETATSNAKASKISVPEQPKELETIQSETDKLNKVDYSSLIQQLTDSEKEYQNSIKQLKQVTAPAESFVIERIQAVEGVTGVSAVTEDNDPNGKLGKQGGYTSQIYFSYNLINQADVYGNSIIDKGTNCGGSLEVYNTVEDAENRNSYLAAFDGGMLSSGSHIVAGTIVVRTSDKLAASQQKDLETKIINSLIELK